jgi:hypothetical protein
MADETTQPEELIEWIAESAVEFAPLDASTFQEIALENLATFREESTFEVSMEIRERIRGAEVRPARFSIPDRYSQRPEVFLIFDAFIGVFVEPLESAVATLELLPEFELNRIAFSRPGESETLRETLRLQQSAELRVASQDLRGMASELGYELFGSNFDLNDFINNGDTIQG